MSATPVYSLRVQTLDDAPDGATGLENLGTDVETQLVRIDAAATTLGNRVTVVEGAQLMGEVDVSSADVPVAAGGTAMLATVTFNAVAGQKYTMMATTAIASGGGPGSALLNGRFAMGATVVAGDSATTGQLIHTTQAVKTPYTFIGSFTAPSTGQCTAGLLFNFFSGTGTITVAVGNHHNTLQIMRG